MLNHDMSIVSSNSHDHLENHFQLSILVNVMILSLYIYETLCIKVLQPTEMDPSEGDSLITQLV